MNPATNGQLALRDLRIQRRKNRIQDLEWFDALYRVYLAAFVGGGVIMFLSGLVGDAPLDADQFASVTTHTPHVVGLVTAVVVFAGLRSGARGGPIAIEEAEVRHVLMAPIERGHALRRPALQRLRTAAFAGAIVGATANQLLQRRLPEVDAPFVAFVTTGAIAGAAIGALFVVTALVAHGLGMGQSLATALGTALVAAQAGVTFTNASLPGPFDFVGSVSMWWHRVHLWDAIGIAIIVVLVGIAFTRVGSFSLEALARRSALVTQMKFAVTLQDLRTVVLLRRQLSQEHMRPQPWLNLPRRLRGNVVVARGVRSIVRFPARRILRMAMLSGVAGAAMVIAWEGTTPTIVAAGLLVFVVGLDVVEPLSQEIDQPDRTDSFPRERGWLLIRHLIVPSVAMVPFTVVGVAVAVAMRPEASTLAMGALLGLSLAAGGVGGAALNAVNGAPDPAGSATSGLALPPEMSGMGTVLRGVFPPVVTIIATLPLLAVRESASTGTEVANGLRAIGAVAILLTLVAGWIHRRDAIKAWFRTAASEAQAAKTTNSTTANSTNTTSTTTTSSNPEGNTP